MNVSHDYQVKNNFIPENICVSFIAEDSSRYVDIERKSISVYLYEPHVYIFNIIYIFLQLLKIF